MLGHAFFRQKKPTKQNKLKQNKSNEIPKSPNQICQKKNIGLRTNWKSEIRQHEKRKKMKTCNERTKKQT